MANGMIVAFSGLDGAGKSTQINLLQDSLRCLGRKHIYLWTRGGYTSFFTLLKRALRRAPGQVLPPAGQNIQRDQVLNKRLVRRIWLVIALLDLMRIYGVLVRWWRWRGYAVICDRYLWDTLVDFHLNFPQEHIERWWLWDTLVQSTPQPDAAFLLLVPVEESVRRSDLKGEPFRDSPEVLSQRLDEYQWLSQEVSWQVLDGRRPVADLSAEILDRIGLSGGSPIHMDSSAQRLGPQE